MKILAVDDDELLLETLSILLMRIGYPRTLTVASGDAALEIAEKAASAFDCVLLDIQMPGMDGIELCGRLRELSDYKRAPIIMMTAMTERSFIDSAFAAGATDYATKPIDAQELGARLRTAEELIRAYGQVDDLSNGKFNSVEMPGEVRLEGIEGLVGLQALGNYVSQLSRAGQFSSQVIAIKVDNIKKIQTRANAEEFTYALLEVADAVSQSLSARSYLIAYAGSGCFVCLSSSPNLILTWELEASIHSHLDESDPVFDSGDPMDIEVSVGDPLRPKPSATESAAARLFERAIARAETRSRQKPTMPKSPNIGAARGIR